MLVSKNSCFIKQVKKNASGIFDVVKVIPIIIASMIVAFLPMAIGMAIAIIFVPDPLFNVAALLLSIFIGTIWTIAIGIPIINCYIVELPGYES